MLLNAIGIYIDNPITGKLEKIKSAPFSSDLLENLKNNSLPHSTDDMLINKFYAYQYAKEFHFIVRPSEQNFAIAITSRSELKILDLAFLFRNITHAHLRHKNNQVTLDEILLNTFNYLRQDILIHQIQENLTEIKEMMTKNIDMAIKRCEKIDELIDKAISLDTHTIKFERETNKINRCC